MQNIQKISVQKILISIYEKCLLNIKANFDLEIELYKFE